MFWIHVYICTPCVSGTHRSQERALESMELKIQMAANHQMDIVNWSHILWKNDKLLLTTKSSLQPKDHLTIKKINTTHFVKKYYLNFRCLYCSQMNFHLGNIASPWECKIFSLKNPTHFDRLHVSLILIQKIMWKHTSTRQSCLCYTESSAL